MSNKKKLLIAVISVILTPVFFFAGFLAGRCKMYFSAGKHIGQSHGGCISFVF